MSPRLNDNLCSRRISNKGIVVIKFNTVLLSLISFTDKLFQD